MVERTEESVGVEIGEDGGQTKLLPQTQGVTSSRTPGSRASNLQSLGSRTNETGGSDDPHI